jgi:uncharacterized protein (TIGR00255 family)
MNSMTGFGRAELESKFGRFIVEVSSVNNRFREMSVRLPRPLSALEPKVREQISAVANRGKISVFINLVKPDSESDLPSINMAAAKTYYHQLRQLQQELGVSGEISLTDLLVLPEIATPAKEEPNLDELAEPLAKAMDKALKEFLSMRAKEGQAMAADMRKSLKVLGDLIKVVEKKTTNAVKFYAEKLTARLEELLSGPMRDSLRLEEEVALFAERTNINEECIRFQSHIEQFRNT